MSFGTNTLDAEQHNRIAQVLHHLGIIAERADQGVVITDREGTIHFANTAWASMHGYIKSRKILGRGITSFFDKPSSRDNLIKLVKQAKAFGCATAILQHQKLDRSIFPSRNKIIALKDKNGCPNALIFFSTDISEIEKLQKQLTQATEELQNSRRQIELLKQQLDDLSKQNDASRQNASAERSEDRSEANTELKNQPSDLSDAIETRKEASPKEEKLEQKSQPLPNPPLTQILLESKISSRRSEAKTEISTQDAEPNGSKNLKPAPRPFNAERLKALAYLSRRLNEPLAKPSNQSYPDDDNLLNPPPLLDIEQLKAVAEIAKRLV
jgi:PAS domain S-box-containing protein